MDKTIQIVSGYRPGAIGRIAELHGTYYSAHWSFGLYFEAKVATELSQFLNRYDAATDGLWLAKAGGRIEGSIAIDGSEASNKRAHLRWFILSEAMQGRGVGGQLIDKAVTFCQARQYKKIYLWTFEGLDAARHLYEKAGFKLMEQRIGEQWGVTVTEQYFEYNGH